MPWGAVAGGVASAVAGHVLNGSGGGNGGTGGGNAPPVYIPKDQSGTDQNFLDNKGQYQTALNNQQQMLNQYNTGIFQGQFNNQYQQYAQQRADYAAGQLANVGQGGMDLSNRGYTNANNQYNDALRQSSLLNDILPQSQAATQGLYNQANQSNQTYQGLMDYQKGQLGNISQSQNNLYGAGNQVLQTSQDPQNALYNRTAQQLTDQTRAAEYARGIQSSPLGASVESNALGNFNIDWQNQQLARQAQGLSAAQGAYGSAQGMGNSYTNTQAGLQSGQNQQYEGLVNAAQSNALNYVGAIGAANGQATSNINNATQGFFNTGNQGAQATIGAGQAGLGAYQQNYAGQNQAIQNYQNNNQGYFSGLNQLQSNDLGYMNFGQGAQNQGFNQNNTNNQNQQNAIGQIAGPISNAVKNTNWSNIFGGGGGGSGGGGYTAPPADYQWGSDIWSGYQ